MKNYIINSIWMMIDKIFILGGGLFVYIIVSNYLGPVEFGKISFAVAISSLPVCISQWGANQIIYKVAATNPLRSIRLILSTENLRFLLYILTCLPIILFWFTSDKYKNDLFILVSVLLSHIFVGMDIIQYHYNATLKSKINATSSMASKFLSMFNRLIFVYLKVEPKWFFIPYLVNNFFSYILRKKQLPKIKLKNKQKFQKSFISKGKPFLIVGIFTILYSKISEIMLGNLTNYTELAIFNVAITLGFAWTFVPSSIGLSFLTKALHERSESARFKGYTIIILLVFVISLPFILIIFLCSAFIVDTLFSAEYYSAAELLPLLSLSSLFSILGVISNRILGFYDGGGKYLYKKVFICSFLAIIVSYFSISYFGIIGAVYSVIFVELFSLTIGNYFFKGGLILRLHMNAFKPSIFIGSLMKVKQYF